MKTLSLSTATVNACSCFMKPSQLRLLTLLGAALVALAPLRPARAADNNPPTKLTHQGFLTDANGLPLGNAAPVNKTIVFRIWDAPAAGILLWAAQQVVTVDKGHYSVLLGEGSRFGSETFLADLSTIFTGAGASDRFLEITVDGAALFPRLQFLPAPYAMLARKAMTVDSTATLLPAQVSGILAASQIPILDASTKITGILDDARIPSTVLRTTRDQTLAGKLTVKNGGGGIGIDLASNDAVLNARVIQNKTGGADKHLYIGFGSGPEDSQVKLYSNGTETMTVTGGKVGIGTSTPEKMLDVAGYARIKDHLTFNSPDAVINWGGSGKLHFRGNNTIGNEATFTGKEHMTITSVGKVGIGTVEPLYALHVKGDINLSETMTVKGSKVGIGTDAPLYPLHVKGETTLATQLSWYLTDKGIADYAKQNHPGLNHSIYSEGRILAGAFDVRSDMRIKQITGRTGGPSALESIRQLQVTDYTYVDTIGSGRGLQRGFIAQEVEQVIPEAVTRGPGVVPDVYARAEALRYDAGTKALTISLQKPHGMVKDEVVSLVFEGKQEEFKVTAVPSATEFVVTTPSQPAKVFVYGRRVSDFRTVDYDRIFTTGISAMQEMARQNEALQKRVSELESRERQVTALQKRVTELEGLERQVADLQKLVRQVAERQSPSPRAGLSGNGPVAVLPVSAR